METTTIQITIKNWNRLNAKKQKPGESFDDVLERLLDSDDRNTI